MDLTAVNEELIRLPAQAQIRWVVEQFGNRVSLLASMQKTSSVLIHMLSEQDLDVEVLFVDTGFHFHETLATRDELIRRYGVNINTLYPKLTPTQQEDKYELKLYNYVDGQPDCCRMRKEDPFISYIRSANHRAVILGLRRDEGGNRESLNPLVADPRFNGFALHPLLEWDESDVNEYNARYDVPVNPLHAQAYPSIGCSVCTTPVTPGEDPRAGRWRHLRDNNDEGPQYCGLNFSDGGGI